MARWSFAVLLAAHVTLPLAGRAAPALSRVPNGISACVAAPAGGGPIDQNAVQFTDTMPSLDQLDVKVMGGAGTSASFPGLYIGSFEYTCLIAGLGTVEYGSASGTLSLEASSTPDSLPPDVANMGNPPFSNSGRGQGEALLTLQFDDSGTVVSDVLPDDTPVQLEFTFLLDSTGVILGPPPPTLVGAGATYFVHAVDTAAPGAPVDAILSGSQQMVRTLNTAVGRTIELQGRLALGVHGLAGREFAGATYYEQAQASIDAANSSHFLIQTPQDVTFLADSGHDYTQLPEPGDALLLAAGALVLAAARRRTARS